MHVDCSHFCHRMFLCQLTVNPHIHYMKELKNRYCHCWPLVVTFVYYEFGTLSSATKLDKVPHFCTKYSRDWKCSPVISPDDIWTLISWYLHFGAVNAIKQQDKTLWSYCAAPWKKETSAILSLAYSDKFWYAEKKQRKQLRKKKKTAPLRCCQFVSIMVSTKHSLNTGCMGRKSTSTLHTVCLDPFWQ